MDNIVVGDIISGIADIYFDFNPPIITNTATTTFVDNLGSDAFSSNEISVYSNPTNGLLDITSNSPVEYVEVFDMLGRSLLNQKFSQSKVEVDLPELSSGVYFISIK